MNLPPRALQSWVLGTPLRGIEIASMRIDSRGTRTGAARPLSKYAQYHRNRNETDRARSREESCGQRNARSLRLGELPRAVPPHVGRHARPHSRHSPAAGVATDAGSPAGSILYYRIQRDVVRRVSHRAVRCGSASAAAVRSRRRARRVHARHPAIHGLQHSSRLHGLAAGRRNARRHACGNARGGIERQPRRPRSRSHRNRASDSAVGARNLRLPGNLERPLRHWHVHGESELPS
jgi:hypothetical protein